MARGARAKGGRDPGRGEDECWEEGEGGGEGAAPVPPRASPSSFSRGASARVPVDVRH